MYIYYISLQSMHDVNFLLRYSASMNIFLQIQYRRFVLFGTCYAILFNIDITPREEIVRFLGIMLNLLMF